MRSGTARIRTSLAVLIAAALALTGPVAAQDEGETASAGAEEPGQGQADGAPETGPPAAEAEADAEGAAAGAEAPDGAPGKEAGAAQGKDADAKGKDADAKGEDGPLVVETEDGSVLDDQTYEGEDDDFIPSEEIPVDEPIPFPSDI